MIHTNFEPIHSKICILLTCFFVWFSIYLNYDVISLSDTGPWVTSGHGASRNFLDIVVFKITNISSLAPGRCGSTWWRHQMETFSALLAICAGKRSPVSSSHKGQCHGTLMFSLICAWLNGWVDNREACDLRRHRAHYAAIVTIFKCFIFECIFNIW